MAIPESGASTPTTVIPADARFIRRRTFVLTKPEYPPPATYRIRERVKAVALTETTVVEGVFGMTRGGAGDYLVEFPSGDMFICPKALFEALAEVVTTT